MLTGLNVKNLALIDREEVSFGEGLNILTGETGAGKSILIGSVNVALSAASFKDYVADPGKDALVELIFESDSEPVRALLEQAGIGVEELPQIIIVRKYHAGRSSFRVNQETVTASFVKELSSYLIDIHGQHEHQSLLRPSYHLTLLDKYAKEELGELPALCEAAHDGWRKALGQLREASLDGNERIKQADLLRYEIREIEEAALLEGEDEQLEEVYRRMANGAKITEELSQVQALTGSGGGESASDLLSRAVRSMLQVSSYDPKLEELSGQLSEVEDLLGDFDRSLSDYMDDFAYDEQSFYETGKRLDTINHLKAKYGRSIGEVLSYLDSSREKLERLEHHEEYVKELEAQCTRCRKELSQVSERISKIRKEKARALQAQIAQALQDLNFPQVKFEIAFEELEEPTAKGADGVCFMLSANPGMPLRPLQDTASGGELSRIMLAIKSVMSEQDEVETLIFDEIDTGISGRTAQMVAEKMNTIALSHQVICITHLPQIAAMADAHYLIKKSVERDSGESPAAEGAQRARTHISSLDRQGRIEELARILGGARITEAVRESAQEMIRMADELKGKSEKKKTELET